MINELLTIGNIDRDCVDFVYEYGDGEVQSAHYDEIKGAWINAELLKMLGANHIKINQYSYRNFQLFLYDTTTTVYHMNDYLFDCKYVHQLQNLIDMWYGKIEVEL